MFVNHYGYWHQCDSYLFELLNELIEYDIKIN
jgi:hypothetical protein